MEIRPNDLDLELIATVPDPDVNVEAEAINNAVFSHIATLMHSIPPAECDAITWSFGLNGVGELSLAEIGLRLSCSKTRAWEIREQGLERLRRLLGTGGAPTAPHRAGMPARATPGRRPPR